MHTSARREIKAVAYGYISLSKDVNINRFCVYLRKVC